MVKIAYFDACVETPEEIILAADMVPVRLFGNPTIGIDKANEHIPPNHCIWAKNILEQAIEGFNDDVKGVITTHGCDCTNREFDIWIECIKLEFLYFLNAPLKRNEAALKFFIEDIKELIKQLEEKFNVSITPEKLSKAIKKMNQVRSLLREISDYRGKMILKGSEFHDLVKQVQKMDKNKALEILESKLKELKTQKPQVEKEIRKILLTGSVIDDTEFIRFLESLGFHIIIDDLCIGTKYFWNNVNENEEPLKALAEYHLNKPIYSTKFPSYKRFDILKNLAQEFNVDGVINIAQKFCEPILYDHPYFNKKFKELGIPYLFVEIEYSRESFKQLTTRFEAFKEII
ncbi:MAG: 2-hydroxyacyl-CoA dehydratase [Promethearchaeota archaeon]|nr:MAG: 2-hydroxyacyl-CoA dehydratase [Candidatus Lokiarchaeota archaeon]